MLATLAVFPALAALPLVALPPSSVAAQVRLSGAVETELRAFPSGPQFEGQHPHMAATSLEATFDAALPGGQTLTVSPFIRFVSDRPAGDPVIYFRSLAWSAPLAGWRVTAGIQTVRWESMRLNGPVDVVNQLDRSYHPFANARIGQPMLRLTTEGRWGTLELMAMSRVATRTQPTRDGRLRGAAWVEPSRAVRGPGHLGPIELGGRWSTSVGAGRLGISGLLGTSRDPRYVRPEGEAPLVPVHDAFFQAGIDVSVPTGGWLLKAESVLRQVGDGAPYVVTVVGADRMLDLRPAALTLTAEYVLDSRGAQATTRSQDDLYLEAKARTTVPDPFELSVRALVDRRSGSAVWTVSVSRPVAEHWLIRLATWQFQGDDFASFRQDGYISASVQHSF
jgi:hypothetical protein